MTDNHNFSQLSKGAIDWHLALNDNFDIAEINIENRDVESNLSDYTPHDGAKFLATDTENVFIGDGTNWNQLDTFGTSQTFQSLAVSGDLTVPVYPLLGDYPSPETGDIVVIDGSETDDAGMYTYDGSSWVGPFITSDSYTDADAVEAINADTDHGQTADHDYYTDSDAVTAINNDSDHSSTASHSHTDLTDVQTDQHHTKYTDSEARSAVTGNVDAADLTGASASSGQVLQYTGTDVVWSDQSSSYTDEDAQDATNALLSSDSNITLTYDDANDDLSVGMDTLIEPESVHIAPSTAPAAPSSGFTLFVDDADGNLKAKHSDGSTTTIVSE